MEHESGGSGDTYTHSPVMSNVCQQLALMLGVLRIMSLELLKELEWQGYFWKGVRGNTFLCSGRGT
jgi:hypothetical protein